MPTWPTLGHGGLVLLTCDLVAVCRVKVSLTEVIRCLEMAARYLTQSPPPRDHGTWQSL